MGRRRLTYDGAFAMTAGFADRLIFFPPTSSYGDDLEGLVWLESAAGDRIAARYVESVGADVTVLFAHGNAEDVGDGASHADHYASLGVSVLAFDYPGYGAQLRTPLGERRVRCWQRGVSLRV